MLKKFNTCPYCGFNQKGDDIHIREIKTRKHSEKKQDIYRKRGV